MALLVMLLIAITPVQAGIAPEPQDIDEARLTHFRAGHGTAEAMAVCHGVGEIVSATRISLHRYSVRYDEVMNYNDPRLPRPNLKSVIVEKVAGRWTWVSGDEPTCENFVI